MMNCVCPLIETGSACLFFNSLFPRSQLGRYDQISPLSRAYSPRGRRLTLYALGPRKGEGVVCGVGRWHIITQAAGHRARKGARVCACVYMCILLFGFCGPRPARGDRSDPATLDFWVKLSWWSRGVSVSEKEFASEAVILDFVR